MVIVDANLLLYAYNSSAPLYERARAWLEQILSDPEPVGFSWTVILAFIRISTAARAHEQPLTIDEAVDVVSTWLAQPNVRIMNPGHGFWPILSKLLTTAQVRGNLTSDAHLAALAIENGATLATNDRDFSRFEGLRVVYPLAG